MKADKTEDTKLLPGWSLKYFAYSKNEKRDMEEWMKQISARE